MTREKEQFMQYEVCGWARGGVDSFVVPNKRRRQCASLRTGCLTASFRGLLRRILVSIRPAAPDPISRRCLLNQPIVVSDASVG